MIPREVAFKLFPMNVLCALLFPAEHDALEGTLVRRREVAAALLVLGVAFAAAVPAAAAAVTAVPGSDELTGEQLVLQGLVLEGHVPARVGAAGGDRGDLDSFNKRGSRVSGGRYDNLEL